jgi:formate hydrogenlyase subunit 6/NADH:ubiquinone oxidoreductase subunit I
MTTSPRSPGDSVVVERQDFPALLDAIRGRGYDILGPTLHDGAIVYGEIRTVDDLPIGWTDVQSAGRYRLERRADRALFGYVVGPHSWKRHLHLPERVLWRARRTEDGFVTESIEEPPRPLAFLGVRACELAAIAVQDRVLRGGGAADSHYGARRDGTFLVAVNCTEAGGNCFCVSMGAGPEASGGHDLALTELCTEERHEFVVTVGTPAGAAVLAEVPATACAPGHVAAARAAIGRAAATMGKRLDTAGIKDLLYANLDHPRWDDVAARCLGCANCTMVCPTCFCTSVTDVTDLTGDGAARVQRWDSCFTMDFSYMNGHSARASLRARYRQWLTHKLASWIDQFGSSGCVGCGRCITWCPVGIDITAEVAAIRATDARRLGSEPPPE